MKDATRRSMLRLVHLICGIPIVGYIYSAPADAQLYASRVRFGFVPAMLVTGLWMWKGHVVRRLVARGGPAAGSSSVG